MISMRPIGITFIMHEDGLYVPIDITFIMYKND